MATTVISQNQAMLEYRKYILAIGNLTKPNKAGVQKIHSGNWSRRVKKACLPSVKAKSILGAFFSFGIDMEKEELWATDASPPQKADRLMLKSKLEANKVIIFKYLRLHQNCSPSNFFLLQNIKVNIATKLANAIDETPDELIHDIVLGDALQPRVNCTRDC